MLRLAILCFAVAAGLGWLELFDRQSALALTVVEVGGDLPLPAYSFAGMFGLVFLLLHVRERFQAAAAPAPAPRAARAKPTLRAIDGGGLSFRDGVTRRAHNLPLESGARLEVDPAIGVPFRLVLDQVPPGRAKRAIGQVGAFLAGLPTPPRLQVLFVDCPPAQQPLHILVQGALSQHLPRGHFKVIANGDKMDVMFPNHDPIWREQW